MSASKSPEQWKNELRDEVEALARRVVLVETEEWDAASPQAVEIAAALRLIADQARQAGIGEIARAAGEISDGVTGGGDPERMVEGIERLQQALETADEPPAESAAPAALSQDPELLADFILESREHLSGIENGVLALEQDPGNHDSLHSAFRGFHTIKGLAGFLDLGMIQEVAHEVETLLDLARNERIAITADLVDTVLAGADYLKSAIEAVDEQLQGRPAAPPDDPGELIARVRRAAEATGASEEPDSSAAEAEAAAPSPEPPVEAQVPETLVEAPAPAPPAEETDAGGDLEPVAEAAPSNVSSARPSRRPANTDNGSSAHQAAAVKVGTDKLDHLVDMVGELVVAQSLLSHDQQIAAIQSPRLQRNLSQLSRITSDVQRTAMSMRMVPVDNLFRRMARLVRDVARKEGKRAELITTGNDTELDRNIVEALADPLMHMVRNAVGHGLESPEQRREAGKPEAGTIRLSAYHQSGFIMIDLADDGQGLDCERILRKARERGLVPDGMNPSEDEVRNLIFEPGFSTAQKVNDVSGRGVGMDVVRKNILKLRGRVEIDSVKGRGTTFSLKVPLTLAIIEGLIVGVGEHRYIVPIYAVREMLRPTAEAMSTVQGRDEMVTVRGRLLPVVRLYRKFGVEPKSEDPTEALLLVTETLGKQFCVMVDDLIGKQEVVIKSLGESLKNISGVAGGAILGDGQVGLILDMDGIFGVRKHA